MNKRFTDKVEYDFIRPQKLIRWKLSVEARGIGQSDSDMGHYTVLADQSPRKVSNVERTDLILGQVDSLCKGL